MPTFGPYVLAGRVPPFLPGDRPLVKGLMGHYASGSQGMNVWILNDGTAQDQSPQATYNADGSINQTGAERTVRFLQGGIAHSITAAESTILTSSGFGSYIV